MGNCSKKRDFLTGTIFEMLAVGVIFGLWCVALALINDKNVDFYTINNANLYYSSWGSFLMSLVLFFKVGRSFMNKKKEVKNPRLGYWALLSASSLIMMSASSQLFEEEGCNEVKNVLCNRTIFAVVLGCGCAAFCLIILAVLILSRDATKLLMLETVTSFAIGIAYIFGVCYLTTRGGPGESIGNLYYSTW